MHKIEQLLAENNLETLYKEVEHEINSVCGGMRKLCPDRDELKSCGHFGFMRAVRTFDDRRQSFIDWLKLSVRNEIQNYRRTETRRIMRGIRKVQVEMDFEHEDSSLAAVEFAERFDDEESREVVIGILTDPSGSLDGIKHKFYATMGWDRFWATIDRIKAQIGEGNVDPC